MTHARTPGAGRAAVLKMISGAGLPVKVKEYLSAFATGGSDSDLRRLLKAEPARLLAGLSLLIGRAAATLGVPREEALFATGFDPRNFAPGRLEAALAELRAADFLAGEGFSAIAPVPRARGKTADLTAKRAGKSYAFEVRCVAGAGAAVFEEAFFDSGGRLTAAGTKAVSLLLKKYRKKMPQAAVSKKKGGFTHCGLVLAANARYFAHFAESGALNRLAAAVHEKAGSPPREHICLLSGGKTGVFPAW